MIWQPSQPFFTCWVLFDRKKTHVEDIISSFPAPGVFEANNLSEITEVGKIKSEKIAKQRFI